MINRLHRMRYDVPMRAPEINRAGPDPGVGTDRCQPAGMSWHSVCPWVMYACFMPNAALGEPIAYKVCITFRQYILAG